MRLRRISNQSDWAPYIRENYFVWVHFSNESIGAVARAVP